MHSHAAARPQLHQIIGAEAEQLREHLLAVLT
jgi:hypothetical protein